MKTNKNSIGAKCHPEMPKKKVEIFRSLQVGESYPLQSENDRISSLNIVRKLIPEMTFVTRQMNDSSIRLFRTA